MIVRPEQVSDYRAIDIVNQRAFGKARDGHIVVLHRLRAEFDPELSLVAEVEGAVVGHALFSARTIRLMGEDVPAVCLGPIAVMPEHRGKGVGAALITRGHRVATGKGLKVSYLIGHPSYYPRFGYRTYAYASTAVSVSPAHLPASTVSQRPVRAEDTATLRELWMADEASVDFAIDPGLALGSWVSPSSDIESIVLCEGDEIVGYARRRRLQPDQVTCFLARNAYAAPAVAAALAGDLNGKELVLPSHPYSASASVFPTPTVTPLEAAMARELEPGSLAQYFSATAGRHRLPGRVIWPVEFDV